ATTDAAGGFRFAGVPEGAQDLVAILSDGARVVVAKQVVAGGAPIDARLPELPATDAAVLGRVVDADGRPLRDVWLRASHAELRAAWDLRSDADGRFRKDGLRAGTWQLWIASAAHPEERRELRLDPGAEHDLGELALARP